MRLGLVTLACRDVERMARLFNDLGWLETPASDGHHRTFQLTNGVVLGLYDATNYEANFGPQSSGFRGFTLCVNVESFEMCHSVYEAIREIDGVEVLQVPTEAFWGGGFSWRDPEGNIWDVAWAKESRIDERGGLIFP
jgi:uncharacterized protein